MIKVLFILKIHSIPSLRRSLTPVPLPLVHVVAARSCRPLMPLPLVPHVAAARSRMPPPLAQAAAASSHCRLPLSFISLKISAFNFFHSMLCYFKKSSVETIKHSSKYKLHFLPFLHIQTYTYVNVYMKWKKDSYYDSIQHIHDSIHLKPIIALKNCILQDPNSCIPISALSKRGLEFDVPIKVAAFMRQYPSIFKEFTGPKYNLPWFRLTPEATQIHREEISIYQECRDDLRSRLRKMIFMTRENVLPLKIIQGMQWYLGLPNDFLQHPELNLDESFRFVEMEDGLKGLALDCGQNKIYSVMEKNAMKRGSYNGGPMEAMEFPFCPSKGLRMKRKIENWLQEFQKLPYISPYDDFSNMDPNSDVAEKRLVGVLHELLSLFVEHSAERKKLFCLKKYFGLPQKVHKAFERHPHMFYLSFRNKTCTVILKEAYTNKSAIEKHPLLRVRKKYIKLMKKSEVILRNRRVNNRFSNSNAKLDLDSNDVDERECEMASCSLEQVT
ncbi:hypothetical protein VNO78_21345 [Psophocarpus tetragonolobus]|uniref:PORR domain-containing protein n=1 Tax=Psophocarpus tetragonolobus TaxID=3891 RepID=A0AAN9SBX8_PSOTE